MSLDFQSYILLTSVLNQKANYKDSGSFCTWYPSVSSMLAHTEPRQVMVLKHFLYLKLLLLGCYHSLDSSQCYLIDFFSATQRLMSLIMQHNSLHYWCTLSWNYAFYLQLKLKLQLPLMILGYFQETYCSCWICNVYADVLNKSLGWPDQRRTDMSPVWWFLLFHKFVTF